MAQGARSRPAATSPSLRQVAGMGGGVFTHTVQGVGSGAAAAEAAVTGTSWSEDKTEKW